MERKVTDADLLRELATIEEEAVSQLGQDTYDRLLGSKIESIENTIIEEPNLTHARALEIRTKIAQVRELAMSLFPSSAA